MSLKLRLSLKPVPKALANASLAANLFEKKIFLFDIFFEAKISFWLKVLLINFFFLIMI